MERDNNKQLNLVDYHTHNIRCGHAVGELREYVEAGIKAGICELGLSDHLPLFHIPVERRPKGISMELHELDGYVQEALDLQKEYANDINIKVGIEADYVPGWEEYLQKQLRQYPFDYVLGSIHFIEEWDYSDSRTAVVWQERSILVVYEQYFELIRQAAASKLFDSLSHLDMIKRFGHRPPAEQQKTAWQFIDKSLQTIKAADVAVEFNTSGKYYPAQESYPALPILERCHELGIVVSIGSDAHKPEHVGRDIEYAYQKLLEIGYTTVSSFKKRHRQQLNIRTGI